MRVVSEEKLWDHLGKREKLALGSTKYFFFRSFLQVISGAASKSLCSMTFHQIFLPTHDGQLQPHLLVIQRLFKNITLIVFVRLNSFRAVSLLSNLSASLHTLNEVNKVAVKFEKMFCKKGSLTLGGFNH